MTEKKWVSIKDRIKFYQTIKGKIRFSYYVILGIVFLILSVTYIVSKQIIERNAVESRMSALKVFAQRLDSQAEYILNLSDLIYNSSAVNKYIQEMDKSTDIYEKHYYYTKLYQTMQDFTDTIRNSGRDYQIVLFNEQQGILYYSWEYEVPQTNAVSKDISNLEKSGAYRYAKVRDSYKTQEEEKYFYFYNEYRQIGSKEDLCVIVGSSLEEFMEVTDMLLEEGSQIAVCAEDKEILYDSMESQQREKQILNNIDFQKKEGSFQVRDQQEVWIHLFVPVDSMKWELVSSVKKSSIMQGFEEWWKISIFCLLGVLAAVSFVLYYLNKSILTPVKKLHEDMQKVKEGIKELQFPSEVGQDEIGNLTKQFYDMVNRIDCLEQETLLKEQQKHKLEIEALQAQINPHFLYNTINAVKMLLRMKRGEEASSALTALADIMQHTLSDSSETVTLEDEVNILNSYIYIQKLRYEDFFFDIHMEKDLKYYEIMKFMIQPFLENCFLHGFEEINSTTKISISITKVQEFLQVKITDNGKGMDKETIDRILQCQKEGRGINGIGIRNVVERIEKNYGKPYGVEIESRIGEGTCIILLLPLLKEEEL